ncbi:hypothetical protein WR25_21983 [Diploscapter pachys]|uniref:Large ribosomal subunit protein mL43 n=1 Tax=Diploscapter pachys TaxID=2018661 RepID=A0A2A2L965_9BILA|nr:hypothetical protein WR25_21983 [Diploscapter pachys]
MPAVYRVDRLKQLYTAAKSLNYGWRFEGVPTQPLNNGVTRYIPQLHRVTFYFCKQNENSVGMRNFIANRLIQYGSTHPSVVFYVQPIRNRSPQIVAEYGNGNTLKMYPTNKNMQDVERDVNLLLQRSGEDIVKLVSCQTSKCPSIQGQWTPMTWQSTRMNVAELPDKEFSRHKSSKMSATEYVLQQARQKQENTPE